MFSISLLKYGVFAHSQYHLCMNWIKMKLKQAPVVHHKWHFFTKDVELISDKYWDRSKMFWSTLLKSRKMSIMCKYLSKQEES